MPGQGVGQQVGQVFGLEEQSAAIVGARGLLRIGAGQGQTGVDLLLAGVIHQFVEKAADLADVACHLGHALLAAVEFLEHHHGQEDVVFVETENRRRVVHQHIGVEHEQAFAFVFTFYHLIIDSRKAVVT